MRIDWSDPADGSGDAHIARRARSAPDEPDAASKDSVTPASSDALPGSSPARTDSAWRTERAANYHAEVDAVYRRHAIDRGCARTEQPERETVTPLSTRRIEAKAPEPQPAGLDDRSKGNGRLAELLDPTKAQVRQTPDRTRSGSALGDHDGRVQDLTMPSGRSAEYAVVPLTPVRIHDYDLPEGYKSSPALKGDPYHPDSVAARNGANQELYAATSRDRAAALGYDTRIPAQKAPFDSHGQEVFTNGKSYITPDVDSHNVTNGWKMFNRRGARIGTYDSELNYVKE